MSKSTSFGIEDLYFVTTVTIENIGDNTIFDLQYMRNVDPDQEQVGQPPLVRCGSCLHFRPLCAEWVLLEMTACWFPSASSGLGFRAVAPT